MEQVNDNGDSLLVIEIAAKWMAGTASESEKSTLITWYNAQDDGQPLEIPADYALSEEIHRASILWGIQQKITPRKKVSFLRRYRWTAAAAVFFFAATTCWLLIQKQAPPVPQITRTEIKAPTRNRASIQLANGQTIYLDSVANGQLLSPGDVQLVKLSDGQIAYSGTSDKIKYCMLMNPRGSKVIDMRFVDGSHVWLNAGSSITYPVPFTAAERKVTIDGEAYFEITHHAQQPFRVLKNGTEVTVYGTHFNINAYDNEPSVKVTLLEGIVGITRKAMSQMLKPGQQAVAMDNQIKLVQDADTEEALAWKNGYTSFHGASLGSVLNEIERWYDIQIENRLDESVYKSISFYVDVKRSVSLDALLTSVLKDRNIKYVFDDRKRKLTILP